MEHKPLHQILGELLLQAAPEAGPWARVEAAAVLADAAEHGRQLTERQRRIVAQDLAEGARRFLPVDAVRREHLPGAELRDADLSAAIIENADLSRADLRGADLSAARMQEVNLSGANLREATLAFAQMAWACLSGADLTGARLDHVVLRYARLAAVDLTGADLHGADLRDTFFQNAILVGANLTGASLWGARMRRAVWTSATQWPDEYRTAIVEASEEIEPGVFRVRGGGSADRLAGAGSPPRHGDASAMTASGFQRTRIVRPCPIPGGGDPPDGPASQRARRFLRPWHCEPVPLPDWPWTLLAGKPLRC